MSKAFKFSNLESFSAVGKTTTYITITSKQFNIIDFSKCGLYLYLVIDCFSIRNTISNI